LVTVYKHSKFWVLLTYDDMRVNLLAGLLRPCYRGHVLYLRHKICVRVDFLKTKLPGFLAIDHVTQKNYINSDLLRLTSE